MSLPRNLNAMAYFEAVARRGSISRAAEELGVSPSAVSQQIKGLEEQLGLPLFRREKGTLLLTLEGEQLHRSAGTALSILAEAHEQLARTREATRLNLRVSPSFGVRWLGPRLARFTAAHPGWHLAVDAAPDPTDFEREAMDLEIRYTAAPPAGLEARALVSDHVLPLAAPGAVDLRSAPLIGSVRAILQWDRWLAMHGLPARAPAIRMDRSSMALQLAMDGAGVVLESLALAAPDLAAGGLVPVAPQHPVLTFPAYWALSPARALMRTPVRRFLSWIDDETEAHRAEVEGLMAEHGLTAQPVTP